MVVPVRDVATVHGFAEFPVFTYGAMKVAASGYEHAEIAGKPFESFARAFLRARMPGLKPAHTLVPERREYFRKSFPGNVEGKRMSKYRNPARGHDGVDPLLERNTLPGDVTGPAGGEVLVKGLLNVFYRAGHGQETRDMGTPDRTAVGNGFHSADVNVEPLFAQGFQYQEIPLVPVLVNAFEKRPEGRFSASHPVSEQVTISGMP